MKRKRNILLSGLVTMGLVQTGCLNDDNDGSLYKDGFSVPVQVEAGPFQRATAKAFGLQSGSKPTPLNLRNGVNLPFENGKATLDFADRTQVRQFPEIVVTYSDAEFSLDGDPAASDLKQTQDFDGNYLQSISIPSNLSSTASGLNTTQQSTILEHIALSSTFSKQKLLDANGGLKSADSAPAITSTTALNQAIQNSRTTLIRDFASKQTTDPVTNGDIQRARFNIEARLAAAAKRKAITNADINSKSLVGETLKSLTESLATTASVTGVFSDTQFFPSLTAQEQSQISSFFDSVGTEFMPPGLGERIQSNLDDVLNNIEDFIPSNPGSDDAGNPTTTTTDAGVAFSRTTTAQTAFNAIAGKTFSRPSDGNTTAAGSVNFLADQTYIYSGSRSTDRVYEYGIWGINAEGHVRILSLSEGTLAFDGGVSATETSSDALTEGRNPSDQPFTVNNGVLNMPGQGFFFNQLIDGNRGGGDYAESSSCDTAEVLLMNGDTEVCTAQSSFSDILLADGGFAYNDVSGRAFVVSTDTIKNLAFHSNGTGVLEYRATALPYSVRFNWSVHSGHLFLNPFEDRQFRVALGTPLGWFAVSGGNEVGNNVAFTKPAGTNPANTTITSLLSGDQVWANSPCNDFRFPYQDQCYSSTAVFTDSRNDLDFSDL